MWGSCRARSAQGVGTYHNQEVQIPTLPHIGPIYVWVVGHAIDRCNTRFRFCVKDFLPRDSYLTFPAVLKDECSLSVLSKLTAVTNSQVKLLTIPG